MIFSKLIKTNINKSSNDITRTDIINYLNKKYSYKTYLEIGVHNPKENFNKIKIKHKDGVDPKWKRNPKRGNKYEMKSDQFFKEIKENKKYDLIFIDGLHTYEQTKKDIKNSLKHLSEEGTIIIHDCNPKTEWHQRGIEDFHDGEEWNGTTWKAFIELRCTSPYLSMYTIDAEGAFKNATSSSIDWKCYKFFKWYRKFLRSSNMQSACFKVYIYIKKVIFGSIFNLRYLRAA